MADIMISIADSDSDSESTTSKLLDSINVNLNSIPMWHFERENVQVVFSSMWHSTKRSIDGNQEAADEGNRKEDDQDDEVELHHDVNLKIITTVEAGIRSRAVRVCHRVEWFWVHYQGKWNYIGTHEARHGESGWNFSTGKEMWMMDTATSYYLSSYYSNSSPNPWISGPGFSGGSLA
ncbi:hypothetical protein BKA82DRAFT_4019573 [Pisolithus tinctorius]|nr:hypothetical protein BKA82DRAFT_4019573 [Pisolithus tinctorius]